MPGIGASNMSNVVEYLVQNLGIKREFAQQMVLKQEHIVRSGIELQSPLYTIAEEVVQAEAKYFDGDLPEGYYNTEFEN